jgi:hypothetical protein
MRPSFRHALVHALTWGISISLSIPLVACYGSSTAREAQQSLTANTCCFASCADDKEAELRSEVAEALAEEALALADANRHTIRADELKADLTAAKAALDKIPTDRKLYFKIAANSISLGLELHGARQFAKGKQVEKKLGFDVCEVDVKNATMRVKEATKTVWEKPTLKEAGMAAVKVGTGTTIQVLTADGDDWTAKIPLVGAVVTIAKSGGELFGVGELRTAAQGFVDILTKAVADEEKKATAAQAEAAAAKMAADAAQKKLDDYLKNKKDGTCSDEPIDDQAIDRAASAGAATPSPRIAVHAAALTLGSDFGGSGYGSGSDGGSGSGSGGSGSDGSGGDPGSGSDGSGSGSGSNTCEGDGDATYLEYDSLSDLEEWDEGATCGDGGCGDSGAAEYCQIFGCDGGTGSGSGF